MKKTKTILLGSMVVVFVFELSILYSIWPNDIDMHAGTNSVAADHVITINGLSVGWENIYYVSVLLFSWFFVLLIPVSFIIWIVYSLQEIQLRKSSIVTTGHK